MTRPFEPVPPSQLFRTLLIRMLETQQVLTPYVRHTTSMALKLCHSQNAYMLSEIASWLSEMAEGTDLTPSFSPAHTAELQAGLDSVFVARDQSRTPFAGEASTPPASRAPTDRRLGKRPGASSRRRDTTPLVLVRNSLGQIVFLPK